MYYTKINKEYAYNEWDYQKDKLTGWATNMSLVDYWSAWSILYDAYIIDMDDYILWVELERPDGRDCFTAEELKNEYLCPYNKTIKAYEPIGFNYRPYMWLNRWSEMHEDWLREVQKNFNNKEKFVLSQAKWDRVKGVY